MLKKFIFRHSLVTIASGLLLMACANTPMQPLPAFHAQPIDAARYDKKVDHLVFVLDASSSMAAPYQGHKKIDIAKSVIQNVNATMPSDLDVNVTVLSFGHDDSISSKASEVLLADQPYSREALSGAYDRIHKAGGTSIMRRSLEDASAILKDASTTTAMILVSDGDVSSEALDAAEALHVDHGRRLCTYAVQVGDSAKGAVLMNKIAAMSGCGETLNAEKFGDPEATKAFVESALLTAKTDSDADGVVDDKDRCANTPANVDVDEFGCPLDDDKDNVANYLDNCPGTPAGTKVDDKGCAIPVAITPVATKSAVVTAAGTWLYNKIQFESGKTKLKSSAFDELDEIIAGLNNQPGLNIEIQGHTDVRGSREYNLALSQKRAASVKTYMESRGIESSRLSVRGFGPDRPIASNDTAAGRAANRRVEIKPLQ